MEIGKTVIISRTDSIGDVVLTLPVAGFVKQRWPQCRIVFLGAEYTHSIVDCCPDVDQFVSWTALKDKPLDEQVQTFKDLNADTILHVFPNKAVARIAKKAGIANRVGTSHRIFHWTTCNRLVNFSRKNSDLHESQLNLMLLKPFIDNLPPTLHETAEKLHFKAPQLSPELAQLIDPQRFSVILHPKSKGSAREWGVENFARLVEILPQERFQIFVSGTQAEGDLVRHSLIEPYHDRITDITGKMSLADFIAFIARCDALIAASTGPLHIAAASGINAIGIYPPMRPIHPGRWCPLGKRVKVFVAEKECSDCRHTMQCHCMQSITPEEIGSYREKISR